MLPRRELRFHALDWGLEAASTRSLSNVEIADLILSQGHVGDPETKRVAMPRQRSSMEGLVAAISALSSNAWANFREVGGLTILDEWEEMLRYVRLLFSSKVQDSSSWKAVHRIAEELRDRHREVLCAPVTGASETAVVLLRAHRAAVAKEANLNEVQTREALAQAKQLEREADELRFRIALERDAAATEKARLAEHDEVLTSEKLQDEQRLRLAEERLRVLRGRLLEAEGSEEMEEVKQETSLRQQVAQARLVVHRLSAQCREQRAQIAVMQDDLRRHSS